MTIQKDGKHVILSGKADKVIFAELGNKEACKNYANCISGTFQYQNQANAILVYGGKVISNLSAHGWLGLPDTCLISYKDGAFAVKRLVSISKKELPKIQWAISGMGLLEMYAPAEEGYDRFTKNGKTYDYSDVLRKTNHTAIGVKRGKVYGFYLSDMTGVGVNAYMKQQDMDFAIMLDGGHIAAVNCSQVQKNVNQKQHNIIQFAGADQEGEIEMDCVNVYSKASEGNKLVSTNFKVKEFACKDGSDAVFISPKLVEILQKVRQYFGKPVTISSAFRSQAYNKTVGGTGNSQHLYGLAADIVVTGVTPAKVAAYVETLLPDSGGIGIYAKKGFTHIDVRSKKARWNG